MPIYQITIRKTNKRTHGFTLLELLIAMVIMGILISLAYPAYKSSMQKSRRSDALSTLTKDQLILERCYSQNFSYTTACGALPVFPQTSAQGFYSIGLSNRGASTYTLTATPIGIQADDTSCASMSINQANVKTATNSSGTAQTDCWNPT